MADFFPAFHFLLPHEGGYVYDPADPGGETKYGITRRRYPELDIRNLSQAEAAALYLRDWWAPYPFSQLASQEVANKLFDLAVNVGPRHAFRVLQLALGEAGHPVAVDGSLGPRTVAAANAADPQALLQEIRRFAIEYYRNLVAERPELERFLTGWLNRARA